MSAAEGRHADPLAAYVDALLAPAACERAAAPQQVNVVDAMADTTEADAQAAKAGAPRAASDPVEFWIVEAAGLKFALPADEVRAGDAPLPAARIVDLAAAALGRPSPGGGASRLVVTREAGVALAVDAVDGIVEVPADSVRWRSGAGSRPWLAGMLDAPRAAVVSIGRLVEEA